MTDVASKPKGRMPLDLIGGWEVGLVSLMVVLYIGGAVLNPAFFGTTDALQALLRDSARFGVMAVGMTFVIANKDLDLSIGSTLGVIGVVFSYIFDPAHYNMAVVPAILACLALGTVIGLINGVLVTFLRVPAFIATLTILFIGRGVILGLTGGRSILFALKAREPEYRWFFQIGEYNALGFNNQIIIALLVVTVGALVLAKTRWGYETLATGGNQQAAAYAGIPTNWVRIRAYVTSSLCATLAGLMTVAQDKGITSAAGLLTELIVIASVIIGGASILGGRGRVIGSYLGAMLTALLHKVLREGVPIVRTVEINGQPVEVRATSTLPAGAIPAFIGALLIVAVLIEPYVIRRKLPQRLWARLTGGVPPRSLEIDSVAIEGAQTRGTVATDRALSARGIGRFFARRDALAITLWIVLWFIGLALRPDYWAGLPNTFAILLNYTELALLTLGLTYVIACADIDLSVGSVLALSGGVAAYCLKVLGLDPAAAVALGLLAGTAAGAVNALVTVGLGLPAFIATLGMFYIARGLAAWLVAGQQLTGWTEQFNLIGRKVGDILNYFSIPVAPGLAGRILNVVSVQTLWMLFVATIVGVVLAFTVFGQKVYATGGNRRAAAYAGIDTNRVRITALILSGFCAAMAGVINVAYFRSFNPVAGQFRELDAIASVIIGGGSIFGGFGTILGALAGAAVITLVRALLQLNIITEAGSFSLPQHWVNAFIGSILIGAVLIDIWVRQEGIIGRIRDALLKRRKPDRRSRDA
ncbi:ABC transporter permease [Devosia nitrariae]|uniref:Sugar ABC transporter permease n=1 Tax=Devosia nitrariae TaxID=2071872 RepID=A0ABQ5WD44_9HYPH|nr:ABC transporter permease [Devosia nitrariae]GLQ58055.1 sugar ABC transporter permease [Devosia nitrariae]